MEYPNTGRIMKKVPPDLYTKEYYEHSGGASYFLKNKIDPVYYKSVELVSENGNSVKILDIGCGRGDLAKALASRLSDSYIFAIDYSESAVNMARDYCVDNQNVVVMKCDATRLPFKNNSMDFVFLLDVVEHLYPEQLNTTLQEILRIMKKNGRLMIHTFPTRYMNDIAHFILKVLNRESIGQRLHVNTQSIFSIKSGH